MIRNRSNIQNNKPPVSRERHNTVMFKNLRMGRRGFGHAFSCAICKNLYFSISIKNLYYRGLAEWRNEKGWLMDTCRDGQDTFVKLLDMLEIPYG